MLYWLFLITLVMLGVFNKLSTDQMFEYLAWYSIVYTAVVHVVSLTLALVEVFTGYPLYKRGKDLFSPRE